MNAVKIYKPNTPGLRGKITLDFKNLSKFKPEKSLTKYKHRTKGRNNRGVITIRHRGGGHKKLYREIDFKRNLLNVEGTVTSIEYDPNRNVNICLIHYENGEKRYILHPENLKIGAKIVSGSGISITEGNCLQLSEIPIGTEVHNIEFFPKRGGQIVRSAGTSARIIAKDNNYAVLRLPSKEIRLISEKCFASVGKLSNSEINLTQLGKAGRSRWIGRRPVVRGVVMNPCDHPHGGGEGKSPIGRPSPVTPWGKPALGVKTRKRRSKTNIYIIKQRN